LKAVILYVQGIREPALSEMKEVMSEDTPPHSLDDGSARVIMTAMLKGKDPWPVAKRVLIT
jgi:hypothetical protein